MPMSYKQHVRALLAMIGMVGVALGSDALVIGASPIAASVDEAEIRFSDGQDSTKNGRNLVFRSARRPIVVPISFRIIDGGPRIQEDAVEVVLEALGKHPRRLITLEVDGLPISFNSLPRSTRGKLLERGGPEFAARYDRFAANEFAKLLDAIRASRPNAPLAIQGLPFDDGRRKASPVK